jgi:hypothetical protein
MLKRLTVDYKSLYCGLIKAVKYKEDLVEIETERKMN